jgi:hypothetical protein
LPSQFFVEISSSFFISETTDDTSHGVFPSLKVRADGAGDGFEEKIGGVQHPEGLREGGEGGREGGKDEKVSEDLVACCLARTPPTAYGYYYT